MKTKHTKELKNFKLKLILTLLIVDAIAVILVYFIMPSVQNFPPFSEDFAFQAEVQQFTHIQQYTVVYIIGICIHLLSFSFLMKKIYKYLDKYYQKKEISYEEIKNVRKDCINIPYKIFFVQMVLITSIGIFVSLLIILNHFSLGLYVNVVPSSFI